MKHYPHILSKLFYEPAIITPARHAAICQIVDARMASGAFTIAADGNAMPEMPEDESEARQISDTIIIPVHGTIVPHAQDLGRSECGCVLEELNPMIDAAEQDPNIKQIIFDFRTPGGTVTGVPETGRKIRDSRKKTIAFTGSECCSGGLWLAAQCRYFYATQSSRIGSVGVYTMCLDITKALKNEGVKVNAISAGKYKLLGAYWKPLADEERAIIQKNVDKIYAQFKEAMETNRMVEDANFGNGLVFDGEEAAQLGFTDGVVESMDEIFDNMVELD